MPSQVFQLSAAASSLEMYWQRKLSAWQPMPKSMPHWLFVVQQPKALIESVPGDPVATKFGRAQRSSILGKARQLVPALMPQPPENASMQQSSSPFRESGNTQISLAQWNLPSPVLAGALLPLPALPPPPLLSLPH